jgi:transposase-like protein
VGASLFDVQLGFQTLRRVTSCYDSVKEYSMLFRADVLCPQCKQEHVVKVDAPTMPDKDIIFRYRCPFTGKLVKQSLRLYHEASGFAANAIPGWHI